MNRDLAVRASDVRSRIVVRLENLEALLRGGVALFDASEETTRDEWHAYISGLRMGTRYSGVLAFGFLRAFPCRERESIVAWARASGIPDFRAWPDLAPDRQECSAVVWIEPPTGNNLRALGFDGLSETIRRATLESARDRDDTALSSRLALVQDVRKGPRPGALLCAPVYRAGTPHASVAERREQIRGWVYAIVRMDDLMAAILGDLLAEEGRQLRLRIWDGARPGDDALLWESRGAPAAERVPAAALILPVAFAGHRWTLGFDPASPASTLFAGRTWLIASAGAVVSVLVFALLVSHRKLRLLNEELESRVTERTRALDESNRELQAFAYTIAHDLKAPLRAISGFTAVVVGEKGAGLDEEARGLLGRVLDAAHRGGLLIEGLLRHARLARAPVARQAIDVTAVARAVAEGLEARYPEREVAWSVAAGLVADADPGLVRELLEELLENAWKFTARKVAARVEVGATREDGEPVFFVRDDGAGFDPSHAHRLFEPFERAHRTDDFAGVGIGLAIAARIVRRHGGRIRAEGAPGRGATVAFSLGSRPAG